MIFILVVVVLVMVLVGYLIYRAKGGDKNSLVENYGGPIKNIQKLPKGVCMSICKQYKDQCMSLPSIQISGDYGYCDRQHQSCAAECTYSNYQRM